MQTTHEKKEISPIAIAYKPNVNKNEKKTKSVEKTPIKIVQ